MKKIFILALLAFLTTYSYTAAENYSPNDELKNLVSDHLDKKKRLVNSDSANAIKQINFCKLLQEAYYFEYLYIDSIEEQLEECKTTINEKFSEHPESILFTLEEKYGEEYDNSFKELIKLNFNTWDKHTKELLFKSAVSGLQNDAEAATYALLIPFSEHSFSSYFKIVGYYKDKYPLEMPESYLTNLKKLAEENYQKIQYINNFSDIDENVFNTFKQEIQDDDLTLSLLSKAKYLHSINDLSGIESLVSENPDNYQLDNVLNYLVTNKNLDITFQKRKKYYTQYVNQDWSNDLLLNKWIKMSLNDTGSIRLPPLKSLLLFILGCISIFLLPLVAIIPVHYIGLIRERHFQLSEPISANITLKTLWFFLGLLLLGLVLLEEYIFNSNIFSEIFSVNIAESSDDNMPKFMLLETGVSFAIALIVLNKKLIPLLHSPDKASIKRIVFLAILCVILLIAFSKVANFTGKIVAAALISQYIQAFFLEYGVWVSFLTIAIIGPIFEEILCRAVILNSAQRHLGFWIANILQSLVFMSLHIDTHLYPYYFIFGFVAGILYRHTKTLYTPILLHILINSIAVYGLVHIVEIPGENATNKYEHSVMKNCAKRVREKYFENFLDCNLASNLGYVDGSNKAARFLSAKHLPFDGSEYAVNLYLNDPEKNNSESNFILSLLYANSSTIKDEKLKLTFLKLSAEGGYVFGQIDYGSHLLFINKNSTQAEILNGIEFLEKSIEQGSNLARNQLAWYYATTSNEKFRDATKAIKILEPLLPVESMPNAWIDTLAAAYAANSDFEQAMLTEEKAIQLLELNDDNRHILEELQTNYELFKNSKAIYSTDY